MKTINYLLIYILVFVVQLTIPLDGRCEKENYNVRISDSSQNDKGLYRPLRLSKTISGDEWKDAIRFRILYSYQPEVMYELFLQGLNRKEVAKYSSRKAGSTRIMLKKIQQTDESIKEYLDYQSRRQQVIQKPLEEWDNSKDRDPKKLREIVKYVDKQAPHPKEITIDVTSITVTDSRIKNRIEELEKNLRKFFVDYSFGWGAGGVTYKIEVFNSIGYDYSFRIWSPYKGSKAYSIVNDFTNIIERIENLSSKE